MTPRQERSRKTVQHILDTAADLLDEVGVDDFNTNLLATRAEVRVRTVYRYFPHKTAVLVALGERALREMDAWVRADMEGVADWREALEHATRRLYERLRTRPGHAAIRRAMRAVPELYALDQQDNARLARMYAQDLRQIAPDLAPARAHRVARCLIESTIAIIDLALQESPARGRALVGEAAKMQRGYIETALAEAKRARPS